MSWYALYHFTFAQYLSNFISPAIAFSLICTAYRDHYSNAATVIFFHISRIMRFIRAVVSLPDMIAIALVCITSVQSDIPTSLARFICERIITVAIILSAVKIKKLSAVLAFVRDPL